MSSTLSVLALAALLPAASALRVGLSSPPALRCASPHCTATLDKPTTAAATKPPSDYRKSGGCGQDESVKNRRCPGRRDKFGLRASGAAQLALLLLRLVEEQRFSSQPPLRRRRPRRPPFL